MRCRTVFGAALAALLLCGLALRSEQLRWQQRAGSTLTLMCPPMGVFTRRLPEKCYISSGGH